MENLNQKLFSLQSEIGVITKDAVNPFYQSKYFDINTLLAELKPKLENKKLVLLQPLTNVDGKPALETTLIDTESNESKTSITILPENSDPQKMGSIITYFRRYSLQSLLALEAEDDDGNAGSTPVKPTQQPTVAPKVTQSVPKEAEPFISGDKIEGGPCPDCHIAKIVKNPKTGKLFCEAKCWLPK